MGFWNRLALVIGLLGSLGWATYWILSSRAESMQSSQSGFSACLDGVARPGSDLTYAFCEDIWLRERWLPGWFEWFQAVGAMLALSLLAYGLIRLFLAIAFWVWRGRKSSAEQ